jgi:hypothetical protein
LSDLFVEGIVQGALNIRLCSKATSYCVDNVSSFIHWSNWDTLSLSLSV